MKQQQRKDRLVSRLYYISAGLLVLFAIQIAVSIGFDIFQKDPSRHFTFMPNHITGYTIPMKMNVTTFDTLVNYQRRKDSNTSYESGSIILKNGSSPGYERSEINNILNNPDYSRAIVRQTKKVDSDNDFNVTIGEIDLAPVSAEGYIQIKPNSVWLTLLLALRNYATGALILFVLFQLTRLFKRLKNDFIFDGSVSRSIWLIGNSLLLYQFLLLVSGMMVEGFVTSIGYFETAEGIYNNRQLMSLSVSFGGSFVMLFTGLALVVFSKLLNYGYELQQENELTI